MKGTLSLVILLCLGGAAVAGLPEQADPKRLETFVADLSAPGMNGRLTGAPSGRTAETYVEDAMRATGLEVRTQEVRFPLWEVLPAVFLRRKAAEALLEMAPEAAAKAPAARALGKRVHLVLRSRLYPEAVSRNVFGILRGSDPALAEEVILVGAHYDHLGVGADGRIFYGAADNASGTAVVLEAATAFAKSGVKPKRTVVFALWCAEEQGLYGSTHYVTKAPLFPLEKTRMMIQLDYLDDQYGPCISNPDENPVFVSFVGKAFEEKKLIPLKLGGQCASDDCPFLAAKVPAYRFIAYGDHHHRTTDTAENLSLTMLRNTADLVVAGLRNAAF